MPTERCGSLGGRSEAIVDEDDISKFKGELRDWDDGVQVRALLSRRFVNATTDGMTKAALAAADGGTLLAYLALLRICSCDCIASIGLTANGMCRS